MKLLLLNNLSIRLSCLALIPLNSLWLHFLGGEGVRISFFRPNTAYIFFYCGRDLAKWKFQLETHWSTITSYNFVYVRYSTSAIWSFHHVEHWIEQFRKKKFYSENYIHQWLFGESSTPINNLEFDSVWAKSVSPRNTGGNSTQPWHSRIRYTRFRIVHFKGKKPIFEIFFFIYL